MPKSKPASPSTAQRFTSAAIAAPEAAHSPSRRAAASSRTGANDEAADPGVGHHDVAALAEHEGQDIGLGCQAQQRRSARRVGAAAARRSAEPPTRSVVTGEGGVDLAAARPRSPASWSRARAGGPGHRRPQGRMRLLTTGSVGARPWQAARREGLRPRPGAQPSAAAAARRDGASSSSGRSSRPAAVGASSCSSGTATAAPRRQGRWRCSAGRRRRTGTGRGSTRRRPR